MTPDIDGAKAALAHLELVENPKLIRTFSRDFFWYSPVLKARMDDLVADFVVCPNNEEEIIETLRVCYAHNVPVTTRGAGTGNYGQAVPHARWLRAVSAQHEQGKVSSTRSRGG